MTRPKLSTASARLLWATGLLCLAACGKDEARDTGSSECEAGLLAGDLVISELMVNPPGADDGKEWIEIYNPGDETIELEGVVLRYSKVDDTGEKFHVFSELSIEGGQYLVVGDADPAALQEFVDYGYGGGDASPISLGQTTGKVGLGCAGNEIDTILYEEPVESASYTFDGTRPPDAAGNDDLTSWCNAVTPLGDDAFGTPGAANDPCFSDMPTVCNAGGTMRDIVPPGPGDLVISEFMPNPSSVGDTEGEWFEVYATAAVDLNGLAIGKIGEEADDVVGSADCLAAAPGDYFVFAKETDSMLNGGLPRVDFPFTLSLSNSGANLSLTWGETVVDSVQWASSGDGKSSSLDPGSLDATANDDLTNFCDGSTPYGLGDLGSPGVPNPACPIEPVPGMCLDGDALRPIERPSAGDLLITEFMPNPSAVGDGDGEWFEVVVSGNFDLNELQLGRDGEVDDTIELAECAPVSSGEVLIFAKNPEQETNGGLPRVDAVFGLSLVNSNGSLFIGSEGNVIDEIAWSSSGDGIATSLDPSFSDPADNDEEGNFCEAVDAYGDGDLGTPGEANPSCGGSPPGTCIENGEVRDIRFAGAGSLVITEWMADPSIASDDLGEWFEVLVEQGVDLNGLSFGDDSENPDVTLEASGDCIPVSAGTRLVFARSDDPLMNGGITNVNVTYGFGLSNGGDTLFVGVDDVVIDAVTFTGTDAGSSTSVAPGFETAADNDDELNHCPSGTMYGDGDFGTPGDPNVCE